MEYVLDIEEDSDRDEKGETESAEEKKAEFVQVLTDLALHQAGSEVFRTGVSLFSNHELTTSGLYALLPERPPRLQA